MKRLLRAVPVQALPAWIAEQRTRALRGTVQPIAEGCSVAATPNGPRVEAARRAVEPAAEPQRSAADRA